MSYLAFNQEFVDLPDMKATHYTLGLTCFLSSGTKITFEAYEKRYKNLPINPDYSRNLVTDQLIGTYTLPYRLVDEGTAYSRGIELLIQKKLIKNLQFTRHFNFFNIQKPIPINLSVIFFLPVCPSCPKYIYLLFE